MINRIISFSVIIFLIIVFIVFYKGLNKSNLYKPNSEIRYIPEFKTETLFDKKKINSIDFFNQSKFYLLNIWASWCSPCKDEHPFLLELSKIDKLEIVGLNYKDNNKNAKKFITELGNPYSIILLDEDGTKAIEWGAFGVPESFFIYENKIIKKYIGPINQEIVKEIEKFLK